ncbi:MAG: RNA ligase family protein [Bacillota bacterium]
MKSKPLGHKSYGSIPHLPGSRAGPGDHHCSEGQYRIATKRARDKWDVVIVQEKLDGSNVACAKINGVIVPLVRAGYNAETSPYEQHHLFARWVLHPERYERFDALLSEGERVCGEWLAQAHGTRYELLHEPFVPFDIMRGIERLPFPDFKARILSCGFVCPNTIWEGGPLSVEEAMSRLQVSGHGAIDPVEGAVWRVERYELVDKQKGGERRRVVDFLAKYVRPDKVDGLYLPECSGGAPVWNWYPK